MDPDIRIGIDLFDARRHDLCLILPDRFPRRNDLPVQVRQADLVIVDQVKCADAAADKCLADIAADTADAEYCNTRFCELLHIFLPEQKLCSRKLIQHPIPPK